MNTTEFDKVVGAYRALPDAAPTQEIEPVIEQVDNAIDVLKELSARHTADANATHEPAAKRLLSARDRDAANDNLELLGEISRDLHRQRADAIKRNNVEKACFEAKGLNAKSKEVLRDELPRIAHALEVIRKSVAALQAQHGLVAINRRSGGDALWHGPNEHVMAQSVVALERLQNIK